jgi:hypothetical protein
MYGQIIRTTATRLSIAPENVEIDATLQGFPRKKLVGGLKNKKMLKGNNPPDVLVLSAFSKPENVFQKTQVDGVISPPCYIHAGGKSTPPPHCIKPCKNI